MKKKTMIIISITSIVLISIVLLGITYGYFYGNIKGNTGGKTVNVTFKDTSVNFTDLDEFETSDVIAPGYEYIKLFTVQNVGNVSASYHIYLDEVINTYNRVQDIKYILYRKAGNNTIDKDNLSDCEIISEGYFPKTSSYIKTNETIETKGNYYTYALYVTYVNSDQNQNIDQNKTFSGRVQIHGEIINPFEEGTLTYQIMSNSISDNSDTNFVVPQLSKVAEETTTYGTGEYGNERVATIEDGFYDWYDLAYGETVAAANNGVNYIRDLGLEDDVEICNAVIGQHISDLEFCVYNCDYVGKVVGCTENGTPKIADEIMAYEETISTTQDDYGTSYYYRGNVKDNYVNFAGMCWRIVRIDGNGNVKLILEDQDNKCKESNGNWNIPTSDGTTITTDEAVGNYGYELKNVDSDSSNETIMNYLNPTANADSSMVNAFRFFQTNLETVLDKNEKELSDYLVSGNWCFANNAYTRSGSSNSYTFTLINSLNYSSTMYYDSYVRLYPGNKNGFNPTLNCTGEAIDTYNDSTPMYVGALTADELVYAGARWGEVNYNFYLMNGYNSDNFGFWTLSSYGYENNVDKVFTMDYDGWLYVGNANGSSAFRPSVVLKSGVILDSNVPNQNGTKEHPYEVG